MVKYIFVIILSLVSVVLFSQNEQDNVVVNGIIFDADTHMKLQYITVTVQDIESKKIVSDLTDKEGKFELHIPKGKYYFITSSLSFKPLIIDVLKVDQELELGIIELEQIVEELNEVEIVAKNNLVDYKFNRKIYNASKDMANAGGNAITVLENTPSVLIDDEGFITVRGNSAQVLVNGKPYGGQQNNADILSLIPSNSINKVEIITRSAKYDAEGGGGIINIVLKQGIDQGLNGSIEGHIGVPDNDGASGFLNYKTEKINLFSTVSFNHKNRIKNTNIEQIFLDNNEDPLGNFDETRRDDRQSNNLLINLGSDFYLSEKSTLTASLLYSNSNKNYYSDLYLNDYAPINDLNRSSFRDVFDETNENFMEAFINFQTIFNEQGQQLSVRANYDNNESNNDTFITDTETFPGSDVTNQYSVFDQFLNNYYFQIDYEHPFKNGSLLEIGHKSNFRIYQNDYMVSGLNPQTQTFTPLSDFSNIVDYNENIYALYANYSKEYEKFRFAVGLRAEITNTEITEFNSDESFRNDYNDIFPNASIGYTFENLSSLSLTYWRYIDRPTIKQLNPFSSFTDERFIFIGNPYLQPFRSNFFMLEYNKEFKKLSTNTTLYFLQSKEKIFYVVEKMGVQTSEGYDIFRRTPINNGTYSYTGLEVELTYNPIKKLRLYGFINPYYAILSDTKDNIYDNEDLIWFARLQGLYRITNSFRIQMSYVYQSAQRTAITELGTYQYATLGLSKDLMKGKATLSFNVNDLFNSKKGDYKTLEANTITNYDFRYNTQYLLTFAYRFNNAKTRNVNNRARDTDKNVFEVEYEIK